MDQGEGLVMGPALVGKELVVGPGLVVWPGLVVGPGLVVEPCRAGCAKTRAGCGAIPCCEAGVARASSACQGRM